LLISATWEKLYPGDEFLAPNWIRHEPISLHVKPNWANTTTRAEASAAGRAVGEEEAGAEDVAEDRAARSSQPSSKPSWAKKLKDKMKTLFCMQAKGQYRTHVASKESRRRDKKVMRLFGEDVSGGSEDAITPEAAWMAKQGFKWTSSEEDIEETVPAAESDEEHEEHWDDFSA
jgi:hypothetical protein